MALHEQGVPLTVLQPIATSDVSMDGRHGWKA